MHAFGLELHIVFVVVAVSNDSNDSNVSSSSLRARTRAKPKKVVGFERRYCNMNRVWACLHSQQTVVCVCACVHMYQCKSVYYTSHCWLAGPGWTFILYGRKYFSNRIASIRIHVRTYHNTYRCVYTCICVCVCLCLCGAHVHRVLCMCVCWHYDCVATHHALAKRAQFRLSARITTSTACAFWWFLRFDLLHFGSTFAYLCTLCTCLFS